MPIPIKLPDWIKSRVQYSRLLVGICVIVLTLVSFGCRTPEVPHPQASKTNEDVVFSEITEAAGLSDFQHVNGAMGKKWFPESVGAGTAFIDYDSDGWQDIIIIGGGAWNPVMDRQVLKLWLYRNRGDGTFTLVSDQTGLEYLSGYGFGIAAADYDNDGDEDLYFTTLEHNLLLRNDDGVFHDATRAAGLNSPPAWSTSSIFFDADRDGHLDLYVGNYVTWSQDNDLRCSADGKTKAYCTPELYEGTPSRFYHNNGDGTFTDRTEAAGFLPAPGKTLGVAQLDFNRDGWPDLVVANDTEPDLLYKNNSGAEQPPTFSEVGVVSGTAFDERGRARAGMGVDAGVVDATGEETVFVGNFSNEMIGVYRHLGDGVFLDRAAASKIGRTSLLTLAFGLFLFDVDLDGDLDLFTANGHVQPQIEQVRDNIKYRQPPHLFLNQGDGTFVDAAQGGSLPTKALVGRGAAYADYDHDGDLDVLVVENAGPVHLWRNELGNGAHYLRVQVEGRRSNRDGLGTQIVAVVGNQRQVRRIRTGSSFLSQSEKVATFGLGEATRVDSLLVFWPNGQMDQLVDIEANQTLHLVESSATSIKLDTP